MNRLFLLEDDDSLIDGLQYVLTKNGYEVEVARSVAQARLLLAERPPYDLLLLDVTLPDGTGFSVCEQVGELCSRIRALLRRAGMPRQEEALCSGPLRIDLLGSKATLDGHPLELTGMEYRLLCVLVRNANRIVTRGALLDMLWDGNGNFVDDNTLSVYMRRLRGKVEQDPSHPEHLLTIRGFGYQWKEAGE